MPSANPLRGSAYVPSDKSIAHRALIFGAMARGSSEVSGRLFGEDVLSTLRCLRSLGVEAVIESSGVESTVKLEGRDWRLTPPKEELYCGNSGTTMRLLAGALAGQGFAARLTGDDSLSARPMERVAEPLNRMGARLQARQKRFAPLEIGPADLRGAEHRLSIASSQVKGALLLAGLQAQGSTKVIEPQITRDHTERLLGWLGVELNRTPLSVAVPDGAVPRTLSSFNLEVPGDFSSAAYLVVAACIVAGSHVRIEECGLNPTRIAFAQCLSQMGADIELSPGTLAPEPRGSIEVRSSHLQGISVSEGGVAGIIDEIPILCVAATQAQGETVITGAQELRAKESDRITAMVGELRALGGHVEELPDGIAVEGPTTLHGGTVSSHGDHRVALALAVAALVARGEVVIDGWSATGISFPNFAELLAGLQG